MSRSKHTEAQMIAAVKQMEAGRRAEDVAREVGVSTHTIYAWKSKYGGMDVSEAQEAASLKAISGSVRPFADRRDSSQRMTCQRQNPQESPERGRASTRRPLWQQIH